MTKAKKNLEKIKDRTKTVGKGSLVVLIVTVFGSLLVVFLTLLGLRKRPKKRHSKRTSRRKR